MQLLLGYINVAWCHIYAILLKSHMQIHLNARCYPLLLFSLHTMTEKSAEWSPQPTIINHKAWAH